MSIQTKLFHDELTQAVLNFNVAWNGCFSSTIGVDVNVVLLAMATEITTVLPQMADECLDMFIHQHLPW